MRKTGICVAKAITGIVPGLCAFLVLAVPPRVEAALQLQVTVTVDNDYDTYHGPADGNPLVFIGSNWNWPTTNAWNYDANAGDHLYIVAWDAGPPQMWIGETTLGDGATLLSNTTDWEFIVGTGTNPGGGGARPSVEMLMTQISTATAEDTWALPAVSAPQGTGPWGRSAAYLQLPVWHDTFGAGSSSAASVVFRKRHWGWLNTDPNQHRNRRGYVGAACRFRTARHWSVGHVRQHIFSCRICLARHLWRRVVKRRKFRRFRTFSPVAAIPEPSTLSILVLGIGSVLGITRLKRRSRLNVRKIPSEPGPR